MAIELEISGGGPCLMSSDIWAVSSQDLEGAPSVPIARNSAFHWADLSVVFDITAATLVGTSFVTFNPSRVADTPLLQPWILEFVHGGPRRHEFVLEEIFLIPSDPLPAALEFNLLTDRHVAKSNSAVTLTEANGFLRLFFNAFNIELLNKVMHQLQFFSNRRTC